MQRKEQLENWLYGLTMEETRRSSAELMNPSDLTDDDARDVFHKISRHHLLTDIATHRNAYTNHLFFTWFFQLAARVPTAEVMGALAYTDNRKRNALSLLIRRVDSQPGEWDGINRLWLSWAKSIAQTDVLNTAAFFSLLAQTEMVESKCTALEYLIDHRRSIFTELLSWMDGLFARDDQTVSAAMLSTLKRGAHAAWLLEQILQAKDQQCLNDYLVLLQKMLVNYAIAPAELLSLMQKSKQPDFFTKQFAALPVKVRQLYDNMLEEVQFAIVHEESFKKFIDAVCANRKPEPILLNGRLLSDDELRPLLLKYIDRLPRAERQDAFEIALDKNHPFGQFMLKKGWFSSEKDKAFEDKMNLVSKWSTQAARIGSRVGTPAIRVGFFQPKEPTVEVRVVKRMNWN